MLTRHNKLNILFLVGADELTDKKAQKQAQNREHEEQLRSQRVVVVTNSHVFCVIFGLRFSTDTFQNPFERVMELIGPTVSSSGSSETQIMHSLLVRLKQQPPPSRRGDSSSTPSSDKREQPLEESQREEVSSSTTPTTTTLEE